MSEIKLLKLGQSETNQSLLDLGFEKVKLCGKGRKGMVLALGFGYIESLILTMNSNINNQIYILPMINQIISNPAGFDELSTVFQQIISKEANHNEFFRSSKTDLALQDQIINFVEQAFFLDESNEIESIYKILPQVSQRLNLQFIFYYAEGACKEIKNNMHINANIINIFISSFEGEQEFFLLYHREYSVFSEPNRNVTNLIFFQGSESEREYSELVDEVYKCVRLMVEKKFVSEEDKALIYEGVQLLEQVFPLNEELEMLKP